MYFFHLIAIPKPDGSIRSESLQIEGIETRRLAIESLAGSNGFVISFEEAVERLNNIERMFVELDGSFVWVSEKGGRSIQIDGLLNDLYGQVISVELKGNHYPAVDTILNVLGWPDRPIVIQDVRRGLFFDEAAYRSFYASLIEA